MMFLPDLKLSGALGESVINSVEYWMRELLRADDSAPMNTGIVEAIFREDPCVSESIVW